MHAWVRVIVHARLCMCVVSNEPTSDMCLEKCRMHDQFVLPDPSPYAQQELGYCSVLYENSSRCQLPCI
jgi:hypothetical protein